MNVVGAIQEEEALRRFRGRLGTSGNTTAANPYLLRYLRASGFDAEAAAAKLQSRREYEAMMSSLFATPHAVRSLQSGAFACIGADVHNRPVLYVKVKDYVHSGDSTSETRLAILVLEYMATLVESRGVEQFTVVVNEEHAGFWAGRDAPMQERLATLVQKHYPGLIVAILVVNSQWGTKRILRLQAATGNGQSQARQLVQFVSSGDLQSFMAANVIPIEYGGKNHVLQNHPPEEFADAVLRHWYALSTALQRENRDARNVDAAAAAAASLRVRPLWQPIDRAGLAEAAHAASGAVQNRLANASKVGADGRLHTARGGPSSGFHTARSAAEDTDDGRCSAMSDGDLFTGEDDWSAAEGGAAGSPSLPRREELDDAGNLDGDELRDRLRIEVQRRRQLEGAVEELRLGTAYRGGSSTEEKPIEAALREHHQFINGLVAEIAGQNRTARPHKTLKQLLAQTDAALLGAIGETQKTPCMNGAQPVGLRTTEAHNTSDLREIQRRKRAETATGGVPYYNMMRTPFTLSAVENNAAPSQ